MIILDLPSSPSLNVPFWSRMHRWNRATSTKAARASAAESLVNVSTSSVLVDTSSPSIFSSAFPTLRAASLLASMVLAPLASVPRAQCPRPLCSPMSAFRQYTYTAPELPAVSSFWLPSIPVAALSSEGAPTASVFASALRPSDPPNPSPNPKAPPVFDAFT